MYWMITNRKLEDLHPTAVRGEQSYFISDGKAPIDDISSWNKLEKTEFSDLLKRAAARFPLILDPDLQEQQSHVGIFVHGYNNSWDDAARRYKGIADTIYKDLGLCVLYTWPSDGLGAGYLPDRMDARRSADDVADMFSDLYDWLVKKQDQAIIDPRKGCRAKISVIGHSMGAYVLQKGLQTAWTRKNQPLLSALINQLLLVAADIDNTVFSSGEVVDGSDGDAMANLCYRITALYTGRDPVLGLSAGFKHFGERRLGRSGLAKNCASPPCYPSNVWDLDCSGLIPADAKNIHSVYFDVPRTQNLMRQILIGTDRGVILSKIQSGEI